MPIFFALLDEQFNDSFEKIYYKYLPLVSAIAYKRFNNKEDAEEIVQDVFCRIAAIMPRLNTENEYKLSSFIVTTTENCCIDAYRKKQREPKTIPLDEYPTIDEACDFEADIEYKNLLSDISDYILTIPSKYRFTLYFRFFNDLSLSEIAGIMGVSIGTVRYRIKRGLQLIRRRITNGNSDDE